MAPPTDRPQLLTDRDFAFSMLISKRAKRDADNADLRSALVHRLTNTHKAVARLSIRDGSVGLLCEPCKRWIKAPDDEFPLEWKCERCGRLYGMECAFYEEIETDDAEGTEG